MNVTEVTCTAYNSEIPSLTTSAAYTPPAANLNQNEGLSLASVAGGVVAALVIGTIIVVVIIIVKRKRSSKSSTAERNEEFVEYTNDLYDSTGEMDSSSSEVHNLTRPTPTASAENTNSLQNSEESTNPEEAHVNTGPAASTNPNGDVYAQVAKKRKNETRDLQAKQSQNNPNKTYPQVQKKQKGENPSGQAEAPAQKANDNGKHKSDKEEPDRSAGLSKSADSTEYVNCPRESMGENSGAVYMNMAQASSSDVEKEKTQVSETDDEYNKLHVTNIDAQEAKSTYNHLGDV
ncbi:enolase-phosphatase E1-like [Littorina saxatilis]|uniref:Uncharacterized protein n=1 Tax=Littorina saxatilis TaxID=31220 RepID=A0AAN9GES3_9CAEN